MSGAIRHGAHFVVIGEARILEFREQHIAVAGNFECTDASGHDPDGRTKLFELVPRTEGARLVVSHSAEFDPEGHSSRLRSLDSWFIWSAIDLTQPQIPIAR